MSFWVKNSSGKKDAMLTFATISFAVVTICFVLSSISEINIGKFHATFSQLDSGLVSIYLGATFTAYVTRKWTDKKFEKEINIEPIDIMTDAVASLADEGVSDGKGKKK